MRTIYFITALIFIAFPGLSAQELFVKQAKITYEKKKGMVKEMKDTPFGAAFAKGGVTNWTLTFNQEHSLYKSILIDDDAGMYREAMNQNLKDEFYFDFQTTLRTRKKTLNKDIYLLEDTIPFLKWKILPEIRQIAGYECRKALTIINDSVYVVAFYTDKILLKGGPEGFNGLPGMILGMAIPRLQTTWFATKVELTPFDPKELQVPAGKKSNLKEVEAAIDKASPANMFSIQRPGAAKIKREPLGFLL